MMKNKKAKNDDINRLGREIYNYQAKPISSNRDRMSIYKMYDKIPKINRQFIISLFRDNEY